MGKGKKAKGEERGTKFSLLHRGTRDSAYAGEEAPSEFVIVPAKLNKNDLKRQQRETAGGGASGGSGRSKFDSILEEQKTNHSSSQPKALNHINELGLRNDGYDYTQHLKPMGEGKFFGADGQERTLDYTRHRKNLELPDHVKPSEKEIERGLETITIDERAMDPDLRAALFAEGDEEGEFEELLDDFVSTAMQEPEGGEKESKFDWDSHIAMLLERSEGLTGLHTTKVKPRGWGDDTRLTASNLKKAAGGEEEDEVGSDDSGFVDDDFLSDEGEERGSDYSAERSLGVDQPRKNKAGGSQYSSMTGMSTGSRTGYRGMSEVAREREDQRFLAALEEYGDEELGYMDYADEDEVGGDIDLYELEDAIDEVEGEADNQQEGDEGGEEEEGEGELDTYSDFGSTMSESQQVTLKAFNAALDEYLHQVKETYVSANMRERERGEGREGEGEPERGSRSIPNEVLARYSRGGMQAILEEEEAAGIVRDGTVDIKKAAAHQRALQEEEKEAQLATSRTGKAPTMADIAALQTTKFDKNRHDELIDCQEYLREEKEVADWDCETVLTTYSTLDNHPSLISGANTSKGVAVKSRKKKGIYARNGSSGSTIASTLMGDAGSDMGSVVSSGGTSTHHRYKSRFEQRRDREDVERDLLGKIDGGKEALTRLAYEENNRIHRTKDNSQGIKPARIVLAGKLGLPDGYGGIVKKRGKQRRYGIDDADDDEYSAVSGVATITSRLSSASRGGGGNSTTSSINSLVRLPSAHTTVHSSRSKGSGHDRLIESHAMAPSAAKSTLATTINEEEEEEEEQDWDNKSTWTKASRKMETKEEKKARKLAAKEAQRVARMNKKSMKGVYAEEERGAASRKKKDLNHGVSVFKY